MRSPDDPETPDDEVELDQDSIIEIPLEDVLDLHGFPPQQVREIVRDYLDEAVEAGFPAVRIIHGKGIGVQRDAVRAILAGDPSVVDFGDAPEHQGGKGATVVRLAPTARV